MNGPYPYYCKIDVFLNALFIFYCNNIIQTSFYSFYFIFLTKHVMSFYFIASMRC